MSVPTPRTGAPSADDLLILLAVARFGRFTRAAESLGINHTTISRRLSVLESQLGGRLLARSSGSWELTDLGHEAFLAAEQVETALNGLGPHPAGTSELRGLVRLSSTDGLSAYIVAPAVAEVQRTHPLLNVEIITATRRVLQHRSGLDIEIVVGKPQVHRAETLHLGDYVLGLYVSREYAANRGIPTTQAELASHPLVFYIDSMLHVDDLDSSRKSIPAGPSPLTSTNVFVHVEATRAGAGIGLLPCFMADRHDDLVRVMPGEVAARLAFWLVGRPESMRREAVRAVVEAIRIRMEDARGELLGIPSALGN
ncbi:LysR family transcriptional regulator [Saxibacter everestensis]|uniref:LysR family transcriptional regulator n=1 Tax=Saxibacter everestensis TaxID=2909229 RepID=A0ABY8QWQ5_9MICO|nr:LysR family transcriptional regulator [Brevibacteriaceae bacterium ZFBP1038]